MSLYEDEVTNLEKHTVVYIAIYFAYVTVCSNKSIQGQPESQSHLYLVSMLGL